MTQLNILWLTVMITFTVKSFTYWRSKRIVATFLYICHFWCCIRTLILLLQIWLIFLTCPTLGLWLYICPPWIQFWLKFFFLFLLLNIYRFRSPLYTCPCFWWHQLSFNKFFIWFNVSLSFLLSFFSALRSIDIISHLTLAVWINIILSFSHSV